MEIHEQREDNHESDISSGLLEDADEYMGKSEWEQAIVIYERLLDKGELEASTAITVCGLLTTCYTKLGMNAKVLRTLFRRLQYERPNAELCCHIGYQYFIQELWSDAAYWYELATQLPSDAVHSGADANRTWLPHLQLCVCYDRLGDLNRAYNHHLQAALYVPDHPSVIRNEAYFSPYFEKLDRSRSQNCGLSLLIPSVPERLSALSRLLADLHQQAMGKPVEILVLIDNKKRTIGDKRNQLLKQAQGRFVAFIDDDDHVSPNYVDTLLEAIDQQPRADCIVFDVQVKLNGIKDKLCKYGIEYQHGHDEHYYYRKPNHLMCYAKRVAIEHQFQDISYGEDDEWGGRCAADIRLQHRIPQVLYTYDWVAKPWDWYDKQ
ncbi:glycosyltransferase family 2 protein [Paenibacillus alvei]|uniref:glycosyltransferase family A protein n=1 Tax=Paenibacillus alvei TaxID=44250 RepID=UPI0021CF1A32|nr:glycosyltransferase family A protein [Paenibacillus alvei]MCY9544679.1 glycosyltransferase family 2 protein [Paenibacillus alvei]MCY9703733.1 glycosyltransferase family 2 protein [Paenibacillus alvei]MCY9732612.1 glycosyltransferase family 2 protein [Paenibacillus alvei]MCY9754328.1 glycosyltransferase family 2 protein [Paenibacillus alvei]MEC0083570.1 glycosyltransferase family A protein [Paenibacillus alvei]